MFSAKLSPSTNIWIPSARRYGHPDTLIAQQPDAFVWSELTAIKVVPGNGFIAIGNYNKNCIPAGYDNQNTRIIKMDSLGNVQWQRTYSNYILSYDIEVLPEGGYIFFARPNILSNEKLVRIDHNGQVLWDLYVDTLAPTNNFDFPPEFVDAVNDNYRLMPISPLINLGDNNVLPIANVDLDNNQRIFGVIDLGAYEFYNSGIRASKPDSIEYLIYPNPAASNITVAFPQTQINVLIEIFSLEGKKILEKHFSDKSSINLDISHLPNGVYLLQSTTDRDVFTDKFIKN